MARGTSDEREREYRELQAYLGYFSTHIWSVSPHDPAHPTNVGRHVSRQVGMAKALSGLRQAVNDTIEATAGWSVEAIRTLDRVLAERGIVTLSELRRRYWRRYRSLITRGVIRNETEYYLAVGVLNDMTSTILSEERKFLQTLVNRYEAGNAAD